MRPRSIKPWRLFKRPNDWQTGFEFRLFLMVQLCLRGTDGRSDESGGKRHGAARNAGAHASLHTSTADFRGMFSLAPPASGFD